VPFVDVFVDVLDGLDRRNALHTYMTAVLPDKPLALQDAHIKLSSSVVTDVSVDIRALKMFH